MRVDLPQLVLASASPARLRLLQTAGFSPQVRVSDFDESQVQLSHPEALVNQLATAKAEMVIQSLETDLAHALVLGCDSVLAVDGEIHGKPKDSTEAIARWQRLRGNCGELYTGHALIDLGRSTRIVRAQVTQVYFAHISDRTIEAYVRTQEPLKCAGAFALEGYGGLFVEKIVGCHSNVIGLSLPLFRQMLEQIGYEVTNFWETSL
ncbi:septum formation inhibitor Maf [Desertifilum sp. FACHB-1129]|uniref:Nucleoside triphosphate pyrophosphatase n=1 Tax=Desertifilum tharense IPPAS B-1220 TaxID=1781255 RepID=A0A1E5QK39_9CYAN|nr:MULTISPECIES: nucleoside triphosphate pyrophosphatase [Desertifilum]MDA0211807.1 Maf family protein [Cyanobacteria bacterium FC1]MBD2312036.1 septum formation inhibitor Maf [Desertifilum sp. FACHB-1129]MBD2322489.1 septum formation inhibitor Maf [Desertifilum sp. FACHB-866]MBD2332652.1 septum formation inhibitor Maf [Desertifilum sp. FACHB-868]OEJ75066.1 septum formation inhibitor Maf [Desertifilum tharense IPPAS B-1220]